MLPGTLVGLARGPWSTSIRAAEPELLAAGAAGRVFLLLAVISPGGMGFGDVKLVMMLGVFLGSAVALAIVAGRCSRSCRRSPS